MRNDT
jgi:hypothetical protein